MQAVVYRRRRHALSRGEREWRAEEDALVTIGPTGRVRSYPWKEFVSVRLCHDPTRGKPWRYVFELQPKHQRRISIDNSHCVSGSAFEERSSSFRPFVREALVRLAAAKPRMHVLIGETPKRYFLGLLFGLLALAAAAYVLIAMPTPFDSLSYANAIKLGIISVLLILFWLWLARVLPRGVPLSEVPERVLPPDHVCAKEVVPPR